MPTSEGAWGAELNGAVEQRWPIVRGFLVSAILAFGLAVFLLVRRATGALTTPLPPALVLLTAVPLLSWAWCVHIAWGRSARNAAFVSRPLDHLVAEWLPPVTLLLIAVACSYPGGRAADWLVWLPTVLAAAVGPKVIERWRWAHGGAGNPARRSEPATMPMDVDEPIEESGTLLQQLTRSRAADGSETISGIVVAEFAQGERTRTLHIAFCPPFEILPRVEAEIADGPDASVQVTQVLHQGARLDVRLLQLANEAAVVSLEIVAHESTE